jgi:hypothetical protein
VGGVGQQVGLMAEVASVEAREAVEKKMRAKETTA